MVEKLALRIVPTRKSELQGVGNNRHQINGVAYRGKRYEIDPTGKTLGGLRRLHRQPRLAHAARPNQRDKRTTGIGQIARQLSKLGFAPDEGSEGVRQVLRASVALCSEAGSHRNLIPN